MNKEIAHEILDRAHCQCIMFHEFILEHAKENNMPQEFIQRCQSLADNFYDLYQEAGKLL